MAVVIFVPPEAPTTNLTSPLSSTIILGLMDDRALFPGAIALLGEPGKPKKFLNPGLEKSSIPLLKRMPVEFPVSPAPKLKQNKIRYTYIYTNKYETYSLQYH